MVRVPQNDMAVQIHQLLACQSLDSPCMQPIMRTTITVSMHMGPRCLQLLCHATLDEMIILQSFLASQMAKDQLWAIPGIQG